MNAQFSFKKQRMGWLYGTVAGLAFSIFAWGVDGLLLSFAHTAHPMLKFIPGMLICALAGGFVGWLTIRIERWWASLFLWASFACLLVWLTLWLPLKGLPAFLAYLEPKIADMLYFPTIVSEYQFKIVGLIVIGSICLICGLMEIHLIDQSLLSTAMISLVSPIIISMILFAVAGNSADEMLNRQFREPVQVMDRLIQYAEDSQGIDISPIVARQKRLTVVKSLNGLINRPRRLILIAFDRTMGQMDILVDFDGKWARCSVIYNQPAVCKRPSIKLEASRLALRDLPPADFSY